MKRELKVNFFVAMYKENDWQVGVAEDFTEQETNTVEMLLKDIKENAKLDLNKNKFAGFVTEYEKGKIGGIVKPFPKNYSYERIVNILDKELEE